METAYLHLITNHLPIIGIPIATALYGYGLLRRSGEVKRCGLLLLIFLGAASIGVYLLGQGGEDFVEELPGVSHDAIENHEAAALIGLIAALFAAAFALFALVRWGWLRRQNAEPTIPVWASIIVLILGLSASGIFGYVGRLGGKIRHPEFHGGVSQAGTEANEGTEDPDGQGGQRRRGRDER